MSKNEEASSGFLGFLLSRFVILVLCLGIGSCLSFYPAMAGEVSVVELQQKAEARDPQAQCELGIAYDDGIGVKKDDVEAVYWYKKSALQGNSCGQFRLGEMYLVGQGGLERDWFTGVQWLEKSALQGRVGAQMVLGMVYEYMPREDGHAIAKKWYGKACDNHVSDACEGYRRLDKKKD